MDDTNGIGRLIGLSHVLGCLDIMDDHKMEFILIG